MKNKIIMMILIILIVIFMVIGGTLAYFNWQTSEDQKTNVVFTATSTFSCSADVGGSITSSDLVMLPTTCTNSEHAIKREITIDPTLKINDLSIAMDLWLDINSLGTGLSDSENFRYALTTSNTSCEIGVISSGTFNGSTAGNKVYILEKEYSTTTTETYYLYIWLDKNETSLSTAGQSFDFSLNGQCTDSPSPYNEPILNGAAPKLDTSGMIPVTISDTGVTKTISADSSNWYSYENKKWANAILVTSSSRSKYLNTSGVIVDSSDILAYYVWIPRYKYKIWTTSTSSTGSEQTIEIVFESKNVAMSLGTSVGEYRTHPSFWWDNDGDGVVDYDEMLAGIWVGKFKTTGNATTPTVLPDVQALRNQNISTQFTTSLKFSGGTLIDGIVTYTGNDTYGLSSNSNSHMMKNSEWGAVAYLSHSKYGINQEIYINNSSNYYTGRSGGNVGGSTAINTVYTDQTSTDLYNSYGFYTWDGYLLNYNTNTKSTTHDISKVASTTGNITGIYDMFGGSFDYTMGVLADSNGKPRSGNTTSSNSGFNGIIYDNGNNVEYTSGISFPPSNYYDLYTSTTSTTACNGGICYGHALSETAGWYRDYFGFISSSSPWFSRGGNYKESVWGGSFYSGYGSGGNGNDYSYRSVLALR